MDSMKGKNRGGMLIISACPADLHLCLSVIKRESDNYRILLLVTWANSQMQSLIDEIFEKNTLNVNVQYQSGTEAYEIAKEEWKSIHLFSMGAPWLGLILFERTDIVRYIDCYFNYEQLELRDINWKHLEIIKFHGIKYWLKTQILRTLTRIKYGACKLELRPDSHTWPPTELMRQVWDHDEIPDAGINMAKLPDNAVIFCFSSIDNGWTPDWAIFENVSDNFFCKLHPRTGSVDYLSYPDWVKPLRGYDLPMELYECPDNSLVVGTTSTALGLIKNSISLWNIKVSSQADIKGLDFRRMFFNSGSMSNLNCRNDLYELYRAYAQRASYAPLDYQTLVNNIHAIQNTK